MLVSKIKPCMSKYKQICTVKLRMLIKSVIVYLMVPCYMERGNSRANTCNQAPTSGRVYLLDKKQCGSPLHWWFIITSRIARLVLAMLHQISALSTFDGRIWPTMVSTGNGNKVRFRRGSLRNLRACAFWGAVSQLPLRNRTLFPVTRWNHGRPLSYHRKLIGQIFEWSIASTRPCDSRSYYESPMERRTALVFI